MKFMWILALLSVIRFADCNYPLKFTIDTILGVYADQEPGSDNVVSTDGKLMGPTSVWVAGNNDFYVTDSGCANSNCYHRVRKVNGMTRFVDSFAGGGSASYTGVSVPATSVALTSPLAIWGDTNGMTYLLDSNIVYSIDTNGIFGKNAGGGSPNSGNGDGGSASSASLNGAKHLHGDSLGSLYIAEADGIRVRQVTVSAGSIATYTGTGSAGNSPEGTTRLSCQFYAPYRLFADSIADLYVTDRDYAVIKKVIRTSGNVYTLTAAGEHYRSISTYTFTDQLALTSTQILYPSGIWATPSGDLYWAEDYLCVVRSAVASYYNYVYWIAGTPKVCGSGYFSTTATSASFNSIESLYGTSYTNLYSTDYFDYEVNVLMNDGVADGFTYHDGVLPSENAAVQSFAGSQVSHIAQISPYSATMAGEYITGTPFTVACETNTGSSTTVRYFLYGCYNSGNTNIVRVNYFVNGNFVAGMGEAGRSCTGDSTDSCTSLSLCWGSGSPTNYIDDTVSSGFVLQDVVLEVGPDIYTDAPSAAPTSIIPSLLPSVIPTPKPSRSPTRGPTVSPTACPSNNPTILPSLTPSVLPSIGPTFLPTVIPSIFPSLSPSVVPTMVPTTIHPTRQPSVQPSIQPSMQPSSQPSRQPSGQPSAQPTTQPVRRPTAQPTVQPSNRPSHQPSSQPSCQPTAQPASRPTSQPSRRPTMQPSSQPSSKPSRQPSVQPTMQPSRRPSGQPSQHPSCQPSSRPSSQPSRKPTLQPSSQPSSKPSRQPSAHPSSKPSGQPTLQPSSRPTSQPSVWPSAQPSRRPSVQPSNQPFSRPSSQPLVRPTGQPTRQPGAQPSTQPSDQPSSKPTVQPTRQPTRQPSSKPSAQPSFQPFIQPTVQPSAQPSMKPSSRPTGQPSSRPSCQPNSKPTTQPSAQPSDQPSFQPSNQPTDQPMGNPSSQPSSYPSKQPTNQPTRQPSIQPSTSPSIQPSAYPSKQPTEQPTNQPSWQPSGQPSSQPSTGPSSQPMNIPSTQPSIQPSGRPTMQPITHPSAKPSEQPSTQPSSGPTCVPTTQPSIVPTYQPSSIPSPQPSNTPTEQPVGSPSGRPSGQPSSAPSILPTGQPSLTPTTQPTNVPTSKPSSQPSDHPSVQPTSPPTLNPSSLPSAMPSPQPSDCPSSQPSLFPSDQPTKQPVACPSSKPSMQPSCQPSCQPTGQPTANPSGLPTTRPSQDPSSQPSSHPTHQPSIQPSSQPSGCPSCEPSRQPIVQPTSVPSSQPLVHPSSQPFSVPSVQPSRQPISQPSLQPSVQPLAVPSSLPSLQPFNRPSSQPYAHPTSQPSLQPSRQPTRQPSSQPSAQPTLSFNTTRMSTLPNNTSISVIGSYSFNIILPYFRISPVFGLALTDVNLTTLTVSDQCQLWFGSRTTFSRSAVIDHAIGLEVKGRSASLVPDINGDGFDDLLIGDPYNAKCYLIFGSSAGIVKASKGFTIFGEDLSDLTGWSVGSAGDVNNDTYNDIIIGAPYARGTGAVYVIYGRPNHNYNVYLKYLNMSRGFAVEGESGGDGFGLSVSGVGDMNADGIADVAVGAAMIASRGTGAVYVLFGRHAAQLDSANYLSKSSGIKAVGPAFSYAGYSLSGAGDVNGDGIADVVIGSAPVKATVANALYVMFGALNSTKSVILLESSLSVVKIPVDSGLFVTGVGDINSDGLSDVLAGDQLGSTDESGRVLVKRFWFQNTLKVPTWRPTPRPSSLAPTRPTVVPTRHPTSPTSVPTRQPSRPTLQPSEAPSAPSVKPSSVIPTETPTVSLPPSVAPTDFPLPVRSFVTGSPTAGHLRATRMPTFASTVAPTNFSSEYMLIVTSNYNSIYERKKRNLHFVINATIDIHITKDGGCDLFTIYPRNGTTLTIDFFNVSCDRISLELFPDLLKFSDLNITAGSVYVNLDHGQRIHILNVEVAEFTERNVVLQTKSKSKNKESAAQYVVETGKYGAAGVVFLLILCFLFYRVHNAKLVQRRDRKVSELLERLRSRHPEYSEYESHQISSSLLGGQRLFLIKFDADSRGEYLIDFVERMLAHELDDEDEQTSRPSELHMPRLDSFVWRFKALTEGTGTNVADDVSDISEDEAAPVINETNAAINKTLLDFGDEPESDLEYDSPVLSNSNESVLTYYASPIVTDSGHDDSKVSSYYTSPVLSETEEQGTAESSNGSPVLSDFTQQDIILLSSNSHALLHRTPMDEESYHTSSKESCSSGESNV